MRKIKCPECASGSIYTRIDDTRRCKRCGYVWNMPEKKEEKEEKKEVPAKPSTSETSSDFIEIYTEEDGNE